MQVPTTNLEKILTRSAVSTPVCFHHVPQNQVIDPNEPIMIWLNNATIDQVRDILPQIPKHVGI
eukprot:10659329-Karenia_brevis.AAC.1